MPHPSITAETYPHKPAIIMGDSGEIVTYRELDERSNQGAQLFRTLGLKAGDHIVAASTLYGGSVGQLGVGFARLGIETSFVDPSHPNHFAAAMPLAQASAARPFSRLAMRSSNTATVGLPMRL